MKITYRQIDGKQKEIDHRLYDLHFYWPKKQYFKLATLFWKHPVNINTKINDFGDTVNNTKDRM